MGIVAQPLDPAGFRPASTASPIEMYYSAGTAGNAYVTGAAYPSTGSSRFAQYYFAAENYGSGASITIDLTWFPLTATTGTATWSVQLAAQAPNSSTIVTSNALATAVTANTAINGTNKSYLTSITLTGASLASVANSYDCFLRVERTDTSISDTLVLYGLVVSYSDGLSGTAGSGDVVGPVSATDSAFARFDLTTGKLIKNSAVVCDASGNLTGLGTLNTRTIASWIDGPASAVSGNLATYNGTTGKLVSDSGIGNAIVVTNSSGTATVGNVPSFTNTSGNNVSDSGKVAASLVTGPASVTTGRVASFNGTTGKLIADGGILVADVVTGPASVTSGNIVTFNGTTGKIIQDSGSAIASLGDFDGPGSAVSGNIVSFNGTTGKLGQDSGVSATAHAARHIPGGADSVFPGTYSANDIPKWNGSAFSPKLQQAVVTTADYTVTTGAATFGNITGLSIALPRAGSYAVVIGGSASTAATNQALQFCLNCTGGGVTTITGSGVWSTPTASYFMYMVQNANGALLSPATAGTAATSTGLQLDFRGGLTISVAGTLTFQVLRSVASGTTIVRAGTSMMVTEV